MAKIGSAVLYLALSLGANAALAQDWEALKVGDMRKLAVHEEPLDSSERTFTDPDGATHRLADYRGKVVLLNFWATWCAPCREEMPALAALQDELGGDAFQVLPVATGRNTVAGIERFFAEEGVETLPILLDPDQGLARDMAVLGLPITAILDSRGREVARLQGDADWASPEARAVIEAIIAASPDTAG